MRLHGWRCACAKVHDIPNATIRRRFVACMKNFREMYQARVDFWQWFDNGGAAPLLSASANSTCTSAAKPLSCTYFVCFRAVIFSSL